MASTNPRYAQYQKRVNLRNRVRAMGLPCALCGQPIDYSLPSRHPLSFELDEIVPISRGGSPVDEENVQPAHRICNQRKGNKMYPIPKEKGEPQDPDVCSRAW